MLVEVTIPGIIIIVIVSHKQDTTAHTDYSLSWQRSAAPFAIQ